MSKSSYTGHDIFEGLKATRTLMQREQQAWLKLGTSLQKSVGDLEREVDAAWAYLGEVVIPSLDPGALEMAASRLALPHLSPQNMATTREKDRADNLARLEAIARDPLFLEREARTNAAQIKLAEVADAIAPLLESVQSLRAVPSFLELIDCGYGTTAYAVKFWQTTYYRHWKRADEITAMVGSRLKVDDFAGLRAKYLGELEALLPLERVRDEQATIVNNIEQLAQAHAQADQALATLNPRAIAWARGRVREHLGALGADEMTKLLQLVPTWRVAGARLLGLFAKQTYLAEMHRQVVVPFDDESRAALMDVTQRIGKMSRPKKWAERVDAETYQKRIGRRRVDKWTHRRAGITRTRSSIESFDRYDKYDVTRDFLWWSVMTNNQEMPFERKSDSAVLWGSDDDAQFAAADASTSTRDNDSRERDFS